MSTTSSRRSAASVASARGKVREFPNGDSYEGSWNDGVPHGQGRYTWGDGSYYDGSWQAGSRSGVGVYIWPTGARYRGEWKDGYMHGVGTLTAPNGAVYQGGWSMDVKHGLGKKVYANGDTYEGLWCQGRAEGPGRYKWANRNEYDGQWQGGRMHGQGTLMWSTGDRYDGEFSVGQEDGLGIFTWADGTTYEGHWSHGQKHGIGLYRPVCEPDRRSIAPSTRHDGVTAVVEAQPASTKAEEAGAPGALANNEGPLPMPQPQDQSAVDAGGAAQAWEAAGGDSKERNKPGDTVFVREYEHGKMVRSEVLTAEELELVFAKPKLPKKAGRKRRTQQRAGETIYKGHRSYDLMLNLQLGIRCSVSRVASEAPCASLEPPHFQAKVKLSFPRNGSKATPPHPSGDFKWKDYCPLAFRQLRELFSIDAAQYMTSICGDLALRELPSPGKSGSVFFLSHDDRYIIKTMRKGEVKLLLELLPRYCEHVEKHPHTLLVKFYGLHRVRPLKGAKVRFIVMNNLFQTPLPIHRRYDLKGSTQGRGQGAAEPDGAGTILKDLDLNIQLKLEESWHARLLWQLGEDCRLLEQLKVMDYSLLLGVSFCNPGYGSSPVTDRDEDADDERDETPLSPAFESGPFSSAQPGLQGGQPVLAARSPSPSEPTVVELPTPSSSASSSPERHRPLRSLESAAAAAIAGFTYSSAEASTDGDAPAARSRTPLPASIPRFESQPLRQDSQPPEPDPEPPEAAVEAAGGGHRPHEKRMSRFAAQAEAGGLAVIDSAADFKPRLASDPAQSARESSDGQTNTAHTDEAALIHARSAPARRGAAQEAMARLPSAPLRASSARHRAASAFAHRRSLSSVEDLPKAQDLAAALAEERAEAEVRRKLEARVGGGMSQQRMADLVALAHCRTLAHRLRHARSATLLLAMRPQRSVANRPVATGPGSADELAHALGQTRVQLGANMAAVAQPIVPGRDGRDSPSGQLPPAANEDAIVFFGVIDILQEYNMTKRLEHGLKSIRHDGSTISAVDPKQYSRRFQDFMRHVFV